jgi:alpha-beta hydrolase superfamily lysophospholipase
MGASMGGLTSAFIAADEASNLKYDGAVFVAPYLGLYDTAMLEKMRPIVDMLKAVSPNKALPLNHPRKKHLEEWLGDSLDLGGSVSPHNIEVNDRAFAALDQERIFERVTTPSLILRGGLDTVVSNDKIDEFFQTIPVRDKNMITYDDVDHMMFQDGEYLSVVTNDILSWLDTHSK